MARRYPDTMIPLPYRKSDYEWGKAEPLASWTSDPLYSYQQFARSNGSNTVTVYSGRVWTGPGRSFWSVRLSPHAQYDHMQQEFVKEVEVPEHISDLARSAKTAKDEQYLLREMEKLGLIELGRGTEYGTARNNGKLAPSPYEGIAKPYRMPDNAGPYLPEMFPYGPKGRPATYEVAKANRSTRKNWRGYQPGERERLPSSAFLKPETRSWPVSDKDHAFIALQYMTRGFGDRSEYPKLVRRLAEIWPPDRHPDIWAWYSAHRGQIETMAGQLMPRVAQQNTSPPKNKPYFYMSSKELSAALAEGRPGSKEEAARRGWQNGQPAFKIGRR